MRAAVVDVGSNSIKLLVADLGPDGLPVEVLSRTLEARISRGIGGARPLLGEEGMDRGVEAVGTLLMDARREGATRTAVVATSAVRDAGNGSDFTGRVLRATGEEVRILTGDEEAGLIGRGLTTDPALRHLGDFHLYDLGGGSLECLAFRDRRLTHGVSLRLGCVRLTEQFVALPGSPLSDADARAIWEFVQSEILRSGFPPRVPEGWGVVGTGGTLTTVRAMVAARTGARLLDAEAVLAVGLLRDTLAQVGPMGLEDRRRVPGLAASRADVFPTALVTLLALADLSGIKAFHHSFRNLRWGIAAQMLSGA